VHASKQLFKYTLQVNILNRCKVAQELGRYVNTLVTCKKLTSSANLIIGGREIRSRACSSRLSLADGSKDQRMDAWPKSRSLNWPEWTVNMWLIAGGQATSSTSETERQDKLDFAAGRMIRICCSRDTEHSLCSITDQEWATAYQFVRVFLYLHIRRRKIWTWKTPSATQWFIERTSVYISRDIIMLLRRHGGQLWWAFAYSGNLPLYYTLCLNCLIDLIRKINSLTVRFKNETVFQQWIYV